MLRALPVIVVGVALLTAWAPRPQRRGLRASRSRIARLLRRSSSRVRSHVGRVGAVRGRLHAEATPSRRCRACGTRSGDWLIVTIKAAAIVYLGVVARARDVAAGRERERSCSRRRVADRAAQRAAPASPHRAARGLRDHRDHPLVARLRRRRAARARDPPEGHRRAGVLRCSCIDKTKAETLFSASTGVATAEPTARQASAARAPSRRPRSRRTSPARRVFDHDAMMVVFCADGRRRSRRLTDEDRLVLQRGGERAGGGGRELAAVQAHQAPRHHRRAHGLYNYRYLQQRLDEEIERARRYDKRLSLLMLDADDFKAFNDAHGHIAGDHALAELGQVLRSASARSTSSRATAARSSRSILPETDAAARSSSPRRSARRSPRTRSPTASGERGVHLTVSIGLATLSRCTRTTRSRCCARPTTRSTTPRTAGKDRVRAPQRKHAIRPSDEPDGQGG